VHGLDIDPIASSGTEGIAAMGAEDQFLAIMAARQPARPSAVPMWSAGESPRTFGDQLDDHSEHQRPEELKAKRWGSAVSARPSIPRRGCDSTPAEPVRDVSLVQAGAVSADLAAMRGGRIQAAILSYPSIIQARREGFRELLDIASLGVPYASTGITVRKSFMAQRRDVVTNYVRSILEATARIKRDKAFTIDMMMKYFRTKDREMMEETYEVSVTKYLKRVPTPTAESFRTVVDELSWSIPKPKDKTPNVSTTIVFCRNWTRAGLSVPLADERNADPSSTERQLSISSIKRYLRKSRSG
jgi:hypothetical protein